LQLVVVLQPLLLLPYPCLCPCQLLQFRCQPVEVAGDLCQPVAGEEELCQPVEAEVMEGPCQLQVALVVWL